MRQKTVSTAGTPEKLVRDIRRATRVFGRREDPHCAGRTARRGEHLGAVPPGKALPPRCITAGRRSSWRLASAGWRAIPHPSLQAA
jgi:hypothetical protein